MQLIHQFLVVTCSFFPGGKKNESVFIAVVSLVDGMVFFLHYVDFFYIVKINHV